MEKRDAGAYKPKTVINSPKASSVANVKFDIKKHELRF